MNAGAGAARCETLLFLHADCTLPQNAVRGIEAVFDAGCGAGIHRVRYASQHPLLRLTGLLTRFETRFTSFGEGALFVRRAVFDAVGGFPEWPLFEDVEILARLRRATRIGYAPEPVVVSARRYESGGVCRQQLRDAAFFVLFHAGVKPARLAHLVRKRSTGGGAPAACARSTFSP
jgi:glycosyl transferase family 2